MSTEVKHFLITPEDGIREFTAEQAAMVAAGTRPLPELADRMVRYLQITLDDSEIGEIKVQTSGAFVAFDADGRVTEAHPPRMPSRSPALNTMPSSSGHCATCRLWRRRFTDFRYGPFAHLSI